jgi:hypothetical protein
MTTVPARHSPLQLLYARNLLRSSLVLTTPGSYCASSNRAAQDPQHVRPAGGQPTHLPRTCKARARAAIYCRLSLIPLGERRIAPGCCGLLRFAASKGLPHDHS